MLLLISFLIVAFGQPVWSSILGIFASSVGFALFWQGLLQTPSRKTRFWIAAVWFAAVQAVHISWMTSTAYMGLGIWVVYFFLIAAMGIQFALLSLFVTPVMGQLSLVAMASFWVFCEWGRLFFLTGFTWSFVGLSLTGSLLSLAWASVVGLYGLSFWVIWVNGLALRAWRLRSKRLVILWLLCASVPYLFGVGASCLDNHSTTAVLSVGLIKTHSVPEEKIYTQEEKHSFIPLQLQWQQLIRLVPQDVRTDLLILPESTVAYGAFSPLYTYEGVVSFWREHFGEGAEADLPPLQAPLAERVFERGRWVWKVSNAFWAQALANHYQSCVVAGFEDGTTEERYAAAFCFHPYHSHPQRYEKRVLVPIGEYIPCSNWPWMRRWLAHRFGVTDSFQTGSEVKLFSQKKPFGISICCEETYSSLIRDMRVQGATFFVNLTNDVWFPHTILPQQHLELSRVRSVENGVMTFRACNYGETAMIDTWGRVLHRCDEAEGFVQAEVPLQTRDTLYTFYGDAMILGVSGFFLILFLLGQLKSRLNHCSKKGSSVNVSS